MSRSRRQHSIQGNTNKESEKQDKRAYNRRFRHAVTQALRADPSIETLPALREHSSPWAMGKDGKHWFDGTKYPQWMRK